MNKKLMKLLFILVSAAVITKPALAGTRGAKHILTMLVMGAEKMGINNPCLPVIKAAKSTPLASMVWKQTRAQLIIDYKKGNLDKKDTPSHSQVCIWAGGESVVDYLYNILMTHEKPIAEITEIVDDFFRDENGEIIFHQIHRAAQALTLVEQFLDKEDKRSLYTFFTGWMKLMEDDQGNVLVGLESIHKFLDDNKCCRNLATFRKNFDKFLAAEKQKAKKNQGFFEELIIKFLNTDTDAPLEYYADKALALMTDIDGNIRPGMERLHAIVVEHRSDKKLAPAWKDLVAYYKEVAKSEEASEYTNKAKKVKDHFKAKYPKSEIPRIISQRIGANIKEKRK